jgi:hypothetical protein
MVVGRLAGTHTTETICQKIWHSPVSTCQKSRYKGRRRRMDRAADSDESPFTSLVRGLSSAVWNHPLPVSMG